VRIPPGSEPASGSGAGAAVLGVEWKAEHIVLGEQLAKVVRVLGLLVDRPGARGNSLAGDLPDRVAEVEVFLRDRVELGEGGHPIGSYARGSARSGLIAAASGARRRAGSPRR
jgi:hypothetical protein